MLYLLPGLWAGEPVREAFSIPADSAEVSLRQFSEQSGADVIFPSDIASDVRTSRLEGRFTPAEALERLLAYTPLVATWDAKSDSFTLARRSAPALTTRPKRSNPSSATETLLLNPFDVTADSDRSYGALNSNSITRFNVDLERMPVSADIINETLMNDVGATGVESMLRELSAGAGYYGADSAATALNNNSNDRFDVTLSLRGLGAPTIQRDAFMPAKASATGMGFTSSFDIERVEVINGPQSLLYGFSGAAGAINLVPKQARLNQPPTGSFRFQTDEFGHQQSTLDFGAGNQTLAGRFVLTSQDIGNRRVFLDGKLTGWYGQVAWRLLGHTTIRLTESSTNYRRLYQNLTTLTAQSTSDDARNGLSLRYLLATGQINAAANSQPSGAGVIGNGTLTWDNIDSTGGRAFLDNTRAHNHALTVDSTWSRGFSTQLAVGYAENYAHRFANGFAAYVAPDVAANPTGKWAIAPNAADIWGHTRAKAIRLSGVFTNELFQNRAQSQTSIGVDYNRLNFNRWGLGYALADAADNPIIDPSPTAATNGYTLLPRVFTALPNGPIRDVGVAEPGAKTITVDGAKYSYVGTNEPQPTLISTLNPEGLTGRGSGVRNRNDTVIRGAYVANYTTWLDGRLSTLSGLRAGAVWAQRDDIGTPAIPSVRNIASSSAISFNAGINYAANEWLRPYVSLSSSHLPPVTVQADPYGNLPKNSRGLGGEIGLKLNNSAKTFSGSIAYFVADSTDEQYAINGTLSTLINPIGLNGQSGTPGVWISAARRSRGLQVAATASPSSHWRMRLSAAMFDSVVKTDKTYQQLYNDQFYANGQGQVTYRDGSLLIVDPGSVRVLPAATAGGVPLSIRMLNDPVGLYYANPELDTARINGASGAATALRAVDPVHGPVLTGATGLPISALQIAPNSAAPPPGVIVVSNAGDAATGTPRYSVNLTSMYLFESGLFKGLRVGGTASKSWKTVGYYYYPDGASANARRLTFIMPTPARFDGIVGYEFHLGRRRIMAQMNVNNLLNRYDVVLLPSVTTGFNGPHGSGISATFDTEPRNYTFSFTLGF